MDLGEPSQVITPTLDGPVLAVMATAGDEMTAYQVKDLCKRGSYVGIRRVLERLRRQGILLARAPGHGVLYSLNRQHVAVAAVEALVGLRLELWARMRREIAGWSIAPMYTGVFGSAARGDGDEASDVDILVIRPDIVLPNDDDWERQLSALRRGVLAWSGNQAQIVEFNLAELRAALRRREPFLADLRADAVDLSEIPLESLLSQSVGRLRKRP